MTGGGNRLDGLGICNVEPDGLCRQASVAQGCMIRSYSSEE